MKNKTPTVLVIMDGFGMGAPGPGNAVTLANTPVLDRLFAENANTTLSASGLDVGLPAGQMGNSEVGHTNIGGGRVVFQDLPRISRAIETGEFFKNPAYNKAMDDCLEKGSSLHLYGLLSSGGVHSTVEHLWALLQMAKDKGLERVYIHAFLDGRDVSPHQRQGLCSPVRGKVPQDRRGQDRHRHGPLLRHGSRQTLGAAADGLRRHGLRRGRAEYRPRGCRGQEL